MACPAGYHRITVGKQMAERPKPKLAKPHIYRTIKEPRELRELADDAIYLTGGQFAILCQFAHPALAEGSFKLLNFANRILNRLTTTARFLNAAVYAKVKGENYSGDDPELHKWTAATLFVALVVIHETFFDKLPRAKQEALYQEAAVYGTSLRMPPELWPATLDEFWQYWHRQIETLVVTDWARSLCQDLLWPREIPLYLRPGVPLGRLLTIYWLPERLQRPGPWSNAFYHFAVAGTALIYPHLPRELRTLPTKMHFKDMRKAVKRIEATGTWYGKKD